MSARTIHIASRTEHLLTVRDFVSDQAREFGFSDEEVSKIALAVDEACTNVIKHAYKFDPHRDIAVTVRREKGAFVISIIDTGTSFNPSQLPLPNMKDYREHPRRGGLGVYLMRSLMDEVEYDMHAGNHNEVRLVKYLRR